MNANQVKCWFLKRGENRGTQRKTAQCRVENQQTKHTYEAGDSTFPPSSKLTLTQLHPAVGGYPR